MNRVSLGFVRLVGMALGVVFCLGAWGVDFSGLPVVGDSVPHEKLSMPPAVTWRVKYRGDWFLRVRVADPAGDLRFARTPVEKAN